MLRPSEIRQLVSGQGPWLAGVVLNLAGFVLLALPALILPEQTLLDGFRVLTVVWLMGTALAGAYLP